MHIYQSTARVLFILFIRQLKLVSVSRQDMFNFVKQTQCLSIVMESKNLIHHHIGLTNPDASITYQSYVGVLHIQFIHH